MKDHWTPATKLMLLFTKGERLKERCREVGLIGWNAGHFGTRDDRISNRLACTLIETGYMAAIFSQENSRVWIRLQRKRNEEYYSFMYRSIIFMVSPFPMILKPRKAMPCLELGGIGNEWFGRINIIKEISCPEISWKATMHVSFAVQPSSSTSYDMED